jgi:hypothetical protein
MLKLMLKEFGRNGKKRLIICNKSWKKRKKEEITWKLRREIFRKKYLKLKKKIEY